MQNLENISSYHPCPFPEIKFSSSRDYWECENRWTLIKDKMGELKNKTLIDIGCASGFFPIRFLMCGGLSAVGIEIKDEEINIGQEVADKLNMTFLKDIKDIKEKKFDFGIYMDLHDDSKGDYIEWLKNHVDKLFISPSGDGNVNNSLLNLMLNDHYKIAEKIGSSGYANREIFMCSSAKI